MAEVDHSVASDDFQPGLERTVSNPVSPCKPVLSPPEVALSLERSISTPNEGDYSAHTMEAFITALEMNGAAHELGWFKPETSVGDIKRLASEKMCVPVDAITLISRSRSTSCTSSHSLTDDDSPLNHVWSRFPPAANLDVVVQMPFCFQATLDRVDDIRVHEQAYDELVKYACQFENRCMTPANGNILQRVVQIVLDSLRTEAHKVSRGWAIQALSKLLAHSVKQFGIFHHAANDGSPQADSLSEKLENVMQKLVQGLQGITKSDNWLERQEAGDALKQLDTLGLRSLDPRLYGRLIKAEGQRVAHLGGA